MSTPCPLCKKPANAAHKPFCSKRCADIDLGADKDAIRAAIGDKTAKMADHYARDADKGLQIRRAFAIYSAAAEQHLNVKMENGSKKTENKHKSDPKIF